MAADRFDSDDRDDHGGDRDSSFRRGRDRRRDDDRGRFTRRSDDRGRFPRRDDDRGRLRDRGRFNRFDDDRRDYDDDRRDRGFGSRTRRCNHCDRCPVHGTRSVREYPSDKFKVVFDDIPDCQVPDIESLCRDHGLEPVYAKITRNSKHAIVEFKNFEDRDAALQKLDKAQLLGSTVSVREFRASGASHEGLGNSSHRPNNDNNQENEGSNTRRQSQEEVDIYADIEAQKPEKGDFDV